MADPGDVTGLLLAWGKGDEAAFERLVPLVERELHRIAKRCMAGERAGHSLQATALVNEAYLRLIDVQQIKWQDRAHFLAMSARLMRRILGAPSFRPCVPGNWEVRGRIGGAPESGCRGSIVEMGSWPCPRPGWTNH